MSALKRKAGAEAGAEPKKAKQGSIMTFFGAPKPSSTASIASNSATSVPEPATPKFDKAKWAASLTPEQRQLLQLEIDTLHESWLALLKDELVTKEFLELKRFLDRETAAGRKWFPPKEDIYSWSRHTPFNTVKVVILGQDPYHNHNQAHGLAFSVRPPTPAPGSLRNMYTALKADYPAFNPPPNRGGLLTPWADRGVLMLNTCLTVRAHEANSHSNRGWERFTQRVIDLVAARRSRGVVFMAWGTPAGKRVLKVDTKRHLVLKSVHPSPLSAAKGFFTCRHFRLANDWLAERYGPDGRVDWALNEGESVFADEGKTTTSVGAVAVDTQAGKVLEGELAKKEADGEGEGKEETTAKVEGEVVEGGVLKQIEAVVRASVAGGDKDAGAKEMETLLEKKAAAVEADGEDENTAPEIGP
ncbi:d7f1ef68-8998-4cde-8429-671459ffdba7 [Thermothielavioides terrestris]|uniref:Uracil-DNA glycosylase n=1 Tax=Thermothielavioides terrestris TaxID=2587410 RepID=A0A3S4AJ64_9PEZI|nr:d7f1ef68-8998-4cde-8429-671459ffdba7 [Thermothielavioides terrestris]